MAMSVQPANRLHEALISVLFTHAHRMVIAFWVAIIINNIIMLMNNIISIAAMHVQSLDVHIFILNLPC